MNIHYRTYLDIKVIQVPAENIIMASFDCKQTRKDWIGLRSSLVI